MARLTLQQDGISIQNGVYVDRPLLLDEIIRTADENQHVVLSSPPATGKSSILELLTARLESENERVFKVRPRRQFRDNESHVQRRLRPPNSQSLGP
jgi:energy-coupling factor transporter ATP-binding protein EcfA2